MGCANFGYDEDGQLELSTLYGDNNFRGRRDKNIKQRAQKVEIQHRRLVALP